MNVLSPYDFDYGVDVGKRQTHFALGEYHFGVLICYEDSDPDLARGYARSGSEGPAVDFLVNMSNDGWFDGTAEHEEHLAICRFRAIECRRAVVRSVNMGISALIDSNGRVLQPERSESAGVTMWYIDDIHAPALPVEDWHQYKKRPGVLTAVIPLDRRPSLYAQYGDWLPWSCWLLLGLGLMGVPGARGRMPPVGSSGSYPPCR